MTDAEFASRMAALAARLAAMSAEHQRLVDRKTG